MEMRIVQAGNGGPALQVDNFGLWAAQGKNLGIAAHRQKTSASDGDRQGRGTLRIERGN
jgi:hypothetical protein